MANLDIYFLTFNCAQFAVEPEVFSNHLFDAIPASRRSTLPEILILSLEEVAPVAHAFLGGKYLRDYLDRFRHAVELASRDVSYVNIASHNVGQVAILVFVRKDLSNRVTWKETAEVSVGLWEMGKGAAGVRIGYMVDHASPDEVLELTFVGAHLHAMENGVEQRNDDWKSIVQRMVFQDCRTTTVVGISEDSETRPLLAESSKSSSRKQQGIFTPSSYLIFGGDLNYRPCDVGPIGEDAKTFPQPTKDRHNPLHYSHLLTRDQLSREKNAGRTLHGLREATIDFPPTYKYGHILSRPEVIDDNVETWDWARHRWPSWTDRILFLDTPSWITRHTSTTHVEVLGYTALPLFRTSDHRPVALYLSVPLKGIQPPSQEEDDVRCKPPFPIDPQWKNRRVIARRKEIIVGCLAFSIQTWDGNLMLMSLALVGVLGWTLASRWS